MAGSTDDNLIAQLEADALDDSVPIAAALRKCVVLGGKSGSVELRDWATRELKGYGPDDELPAYRVVAAPLKVDAFVGNGQITGQQIAPSSLPDFAREQIKEEVKLRDGIGGIEALLDLKRIKLMPANASDLANYMNADNGDPFQSITSIYWAVSHAAIKGVLDQVRTALTQLVAELEATTPSGQQLPSTEAATQAVQVVVTGRRARVSMPVAQAAGENAAATQSSTTTAPAEESGWWTRGRKVGAFVVGVATIVAAVAAVIAL